MTDVAAARAQEGPLLELKDLRSALAGPFTLSLRCGQCAVVTGPSGSGKSLFLRMLADLDENQGQVTLAGRAREDWPAPAWRRRVAYVAAEAGWWSDRVSDHFAGADLAAAGALARRLGLADGLISEPVARLSTGERQRLALVRALLMKPVALLLDEPTGALDQVSTGRVEALLRDLLREGVAILMVTHDEALAGRMGELRYRMADRRLAAA